MLRWFYIQLLWAHPAEFRYRFCEEMLEIFDGEPRSQGAICFDGFVSLLRQWCLRSEFHEPVAAGGPGYNPLRFEQIAPYKPNGVALAQGGLLAILLLAGVVNAIGHGAGRVRNLLIGMHRPGFGLIKVQRVEGGPLTTTVEPGRNIEDPWRPYANSYFRIIRVLSALDTDNDLVISYFEAQNGAAALLKLDLNHDGTLSPEECGFLPPGDFEGSARQLAAYGREFMRNHPVLAALDADHDGVISAAEIAKSPDSLMTLDFNHDMKLRPDELLPNLAVSEAAPIMTRFDTNDVGLIAVQELTGEGAASYSPLLRAADRNHDGVVTRGELVVQLAGRVAPQAVPTYK